jgi:riboflavin kinase/FMN adenylyltransferase
MDMEIIKVCDITKKIKNASIAFGVFDGVHLGHKKIIERMMDIKNTKKIVLTFYNHPEDIINKNKTIRYITTRGQKEEILRNMGVEMIVYIHFNDEVKNTTADDFIKKYMLDKFDLKKVTVGFNNRFGKDGQGSGELLIQMGKRHAYDVEIVDKVCLHDEIISSTTIRKALLDGNIEKANAMLGRAFYVTSTVINGKRLGRKLGFPTANLRMPEDLVMPQNGVYLTKTIVHDSEYYSITNVGQNPTFKNHPYRIETFIIDFDENIYDKEIKVCFLKKIRDEKKFESLDELKKQIYNDTNCAKKFISAKIL